MGYAKKKDARLDFRISSENRYLIELAASISGETNSTDFIIRTLVRESQKIIAKNQSIPQIHLAKQEALKFLKAIDNPPRPNEALKSAAKKFKEKYGY